MSPSFRRRSQVLPKYSDLRQLMAFSFSSSAFYFLLLSAAICRDIVADARHCTYGFACSEQARFSSPSSEFSFKMSPLCIFPQDSTHPASARCIFLFFFFTIRFVLSLRYLFHPTGVTTGRWSMVHELSNKQSSVDRCVLQL